MYFRTEFKPAISPFQISHKDKILTVGSCFSENISRNLTHRKFSVLNNPFGILFHPIAIHNSLDFIVQNKVFSVNEIMKHKEYFLSLYHHTSFNGLDKQSVINNINLRINEAHNFLEDANYLFITYGTAWGYQYKGKEVDFKGKIVGNCHKIPNNQFKKVLSSIEELSSDCLQLISTLKDFNPNLKIVFTLSPVRHLKDGFEENQVSKSILRLLIHQICEASENCFYFPSYELVLDDLRDYRFYKKDLLHPNEQAIEYVWQKFSEVFFDDKTIDLNQQIEKIQQGLAHQPFIKESLEHKEFLRKLHLRMKEINLKLRV